MCGETNFFLLLQVVVLFSCSVTQEIPVSCITPKKVTGQCVPIRNCEVLYTIVKSRPIQSSDADYLKRSQCEAETAVPKVCCPGENNTSLSLARRISTPNVYKSVGSVSTNLLPSTDLCGVNLEDKIHGGGLAGLSEFPWMALLEYETENGNRLFFCAGVLINTRYILTAAHCIKGKNLPPSYKLVSVRLGEYDKDKEEDCVNHGFRKECAPPPVDIPVEESIAHEEYKANDDNQHHDIGVLRLAREVNFTGYVKPICLPLTEKKRTTVFTGKNLTVAGWGTVENGTDSPILLKLYVPVKGQGQCSRKYRAYGILLDEGQICAGGEDGKDTCKGDSGGPLMTIIPDDNGVELNWYVIGIVSFGPTPCGRKDWPGVYAKVSSYVGWIVSKLQP